MYYLSTSCLLLFFLFFFHPLSCASSKEKLGWCEPLSHCGNITAGFPFWGGNRHKPCGHPLLELRCNKTITSLNISNHEYNVFHINQTLNTLRLARADLLGSFCSTTFNTAILPPKIFELSPNYKSLTVLYHCDPKLSYRSSYTCPDLGLFSMSQTLDYQDSCKDSFTINVPTSFVPEERELNLTHLESALREGFEVKLVIDEIPCQECLSSRGICGFNSTTQVCCNVNSQSGAVSCVPQHTKSRHRPSVAEVHRRCTEPFRCGNQADLYYPFWIPGREDCGHPDFKLHCSGGYPQLSIASVKYIVLYMNFYSIIRLARLDYIGDICPQNSLNAPFVENVLSFAEDTELLTLYYECQFYSSAIVATNYAGELGCDGGRSYYVTRNLSSPLLDNYKGHLNNLRGMCKRNVSIPAYGSALETLQRSPTVENLKKAIEQGFELEANSDCSMCIDSLGACGYNQTSSVFVCYCKDGLYSRSCREGSYLGMQIGLIAAVVVIALCSLAGVIALVVLLCPCFGVQIFRKRKTSDDRRQEKLKALIPLKHYTYAQVKKITKSFGKADLELFIKEPFLTFGFSDRYPIRFSCSKNGYAEEITSMCTREIRRIEQLFGDNFAPSNIQNTILVQGCNELSYSWSINPRFIDKQSNLSRCNSSSAGCFDVVTTTTANVMSIGDVVNRTGCKYWSSSITSDSMNTTSGISLNFGRLKLDWWLKEGCSNTTCSENANCTQDKLPGGRLGHRCTCRDRFRGDAFTVNGGCRLGSRNKGLSFELKIGIASALILVGIIAASLFSITIRVRKTSGNEKM